MDSDWFPGFEARDIALPGIRLHARIGGEPAKTTASRAKPEETAAALLAFFAPATAG